MSAGLLQPMRFNVNERVLLRKRSKAVSLTRVSSRFAAEPCVLLLKLPKGELIEGAPTSRRKSCVGETPSNFRMRSVGEEEALLRQGEDVELDLGATPPSSDVSSFSSRLDCEDDVLSSLGASSLRLWHDVKAIAQPVF